MVISVHTHVPPCTILEQHQRWTKEGFTRFLQKSVVFPFLVNNGTKRCSAQTIDNETVRDNCTILIRALGSHKTFLMSIMLSFDPCILTSVGSGPTRDCFGSFYLFRKLFSF